ncbi:MAG: SAM-dependent methyltransferase [Bacteroidia bacterium]|nr:SAM-dependent methyltransferase [Bacteroidia bacterium]
MINLSPIAYVRNSRKEIKDDFWGEAIVAFQGIEDFSHLEIIFYFHLLEDHAKDNWIGHPRGNEQWSEVGMFAQRKKKRINSLGLTIVELERVEGKVLHVKRLDAIDGTPILDIKPVMEEFLPQRDISQPQWSHELMTNYWESK